MRLLRRDKSGWLGRTSTFRLTTWQPSNMPSYAILSHRWGDEEVTFDDIEQGTARRKKGLKKLEFCADQAARDGLIYFWIDTCCIKKASDAETTEAINSMFKWYRNAVKCYVYLPDVKADLGWKSAFTRSEWFKRGWTLQELIAPTIVEFFSVEGIKLGDKMSLEGQISRITKVSIEALQGKRLSEIAEQERFSWTAGRETTKDEDAVYCLLGIFDVHMPLIYGEGRQEALARLQAQINERRKNGISTILSGNLETGSAIADTACEPTYEVFLVSSHSCPDPHIQCTSPCIRLDGMNSVASGGRDGIAKQRADLNSSGESLASRICRVLKTRPNKSWDTRWLMYIYCDPCTWRNELALTIAGSLVWLNGVIRIDDRLRDNESAEATTMSMRHIESVLEEVDREWRVARNHKRSWISHCYDVPWLQRRLLDDSDVYAEPSNLGLQTYLKQSDRDDRVSAAVILASTSVIERLLHRCLPSPLTTSMTIKDQVVYRLTFDLRSRSWHIELFSKL